MRRTGVPAEAGTALVILPGLDGTGDLLAEFAAAVSAHFSKVLVIAYPTDRPLGYVDLEAQVRTRLPTDAPFLLLGESFSGPIALAIAADAPPGLRGVVLSASFARGPAGWLLPFAGLARFAPVHAVPAGLLAKVLLGQWATPSWTVKLTRALARVSASVLRSRAMSALRCEAHPHLEHISVPVLYLRATQDRLLDASAGNYVVAVLPQAKTVDIVGPHLLLQACPDACLKAIVEFLANIPATTQDGPA